MCSLWTTTSPGLCLHLRVKCQNQLLQKTRHFVEKIVNHYIGFRFPHCSGTVCVAGNFSVRITIIPFFSILLICKKNQEMDALMVHNGAAAVTFLSVIR